MTLVSIEADFCPFGFSPHEPAKRELEDERIKIAGRDPVPPPLISVFSFRDPVFLTCYFSNFYLVGSMGEMTKWHKSATITKTFKVLF
jgi:hypothetical protein